MSSVLKNMSIDKLDEIVNKYNNLCHRKIKIKSADVKPSIYININKQNNKECLKSKIGDNVKNIPKYIKI